MVRKSGEGGSRSGQGELPLDPRDTTDPRNYGVILTKPEHKEKWAKLVTCPIKPSRFPDEATLRCLGLYDDFWALCERGSIANALRTVRPSYKRMMLEFLSTVKLNKATRPAAVQSIEFQLDNQQFTLTLTELNAAFGSTGGEYAESGDYNRHEFWRNLTWIHAPHKLFDARTAKAFHIRNPVFRLFQTSIAESVLARCDNGNMQTNELYMLWCCTRGIPFEIGSCIAEHLDRASKRDGGTMNCGGMITAIASHCGVEFDDWEQVPGGTVIDVNVLISMKFIKVDRQFGAFLEQHMHAPFLLPFRELTRVSDHLDTLNWKMSTTTHMDHVQAFNPMPPFRAKATAGQIEPEDHDDPPDMAYTEALHDLQERMTALEMSTQRQEMSMQRQEMSMQRQEMNIQRLLERFQSFDEYFRRSFDTRQNNMAQMMQQQNQPQQTPP